MQLQQKRLPDIVQHGKEIVPMLEHFQTLVEKFYFLYHTID